ncbi:MAG: TetR/AcrR family transcriptional regulator C-terminal domain-containing protein [Acidimicrobiales bacterium]
MHHHDAVLGCLRRGLPWDLVAHAYAVLDSFVYGFALQEANLPFSGEDDVAEVTDLVIEPLSPEEYPNLVAFTAEHVLQPGYDFGRSFEFGLDLLLDGLAAAARSR